MRNSPARTRHGVVQSPVDVELLDLEFAHIVGRAHRVLDLVLGVELGALIELVADAEHRARQVELRLAAIVHRVGVVHLAITPQPQPRAELAEHRASRRAAARHCRRRRTRQRGGIRQRARRCGCTRRRRRLRDGSSGRAQFGEPAVDFALVLAQRAVFIGELLQGGLHLLQLLLQRIESCRVGVGRRGRRARQQRQHQCAARRDQSRRRFHESVLSVFLRGTRQTLGGRGIASGPVRVVAVSERAQEGDHVVDLGRAQGRGLAAAEAGRRGSRRR